MMKWKTDLASIWRKYSCALLILLLFAAHLPFLAADPDIDISSSRGPFTDEGQNTVQARNWVNFGHLDLLESDNFLKTPFFGILMAGTFWLTGISLVHARLLVLLLVAASLWIICLDRKHRGVLYILVPVIFLQYQVFHFSHYSLAEMLSSASILLGIHFLAKSADPQYLQGGRNKFALLSALFMSLSYFLKIQFLYIIFVLPAAQVFRLLNTNPMNRRMVIRQGYYTSAGLLVFLLIYLFGWYLPNRHDMDMIMAGQSGEFSLTARTLHYFLFNLYYYFLKGWIIPFVLAFLSCLAIGFFLLRSNPSSRYPTLFLASFTWFLLELHKLTMAYLPTRYRISLYISMGLMVSVVLDETLKRFARVKKKEISVIIRQAIVAGMITLMVGINIYQYRASLQRRSYSIRDTNNYMAQVIQPGDVVLGAWAPTLTWKCKARSFPVWNHFMNYEDPVGRFKPRALVSEPDEQDSEQAYSSQGIYLSNISDSTRTFKIGQWEVSIFWLK